MSFTSFLRSLRSRRGSNRRPRRNYFVPRMEVLDTRDVPATFLVTNSADAGAGSLRQAVLDANANPGADDIDFTVTGTIALTSGQLALTDSVALNGPGADLLTVARDPASPTQFGLIVVGGSASVQLSGLTLSGGTAGAVTNNGTLTVSDSTLTGNSAVGAGGAILSNGMLTVRRSTIAGNSAAGIYSEWGPGGFAAGGGIYVAGGTLTLSSSTVADNRVYGGAYYYVDPDSPWWPNGGEWYGQDGAGGGLYVAGGTVSIDHSTLAGNGAFGGGVPGGPLGIGQGGGIDSMSWGVTLRMYNTIVADNAADYAPDLLSRVGSLTSLGHNLIGDSFGGSGFAASDLLDTDPRLGPLQDNGGPTPTMALLAGSPGRQRRRQRQCPGRRPTWPPADLRRHNRHRCHRASDARTTRARHHRRVVTRR